MRIIGVQPDIAWEDKPATFARVTSLLRDAPMTAQSMIVLPEMFATGFSLNVSKIAEGPDGPTHRFLGELAAQRRCYVLAGLVSQSPDGRGRNEALVFNPAGALAARYCKLHPFTYGGEAERYSAGTDVVLLDCYGFKVAPFVCYDLRFPEIFRQAVRQGAEVLVVIANWPQQRDAHWLALLKARAIENQAYVAGVNRAGADPQQSYAGHSLIVDPRGEVLAAAAEPPGLVIGDLEPDPLRSYRRQFPALRDMRTDFLRS